MMPYLTQIRENIRRLADGHLTDEERSQLLRDLADLFVHQFNRQNNNAAVIIEKEVLDIEQQFDTLASEVRAVRELMILRQNTLEQMVKDNHTNAANKAHQISNYVMAMEAKLNDIVELLTNERSYDQSN